jgi:hypothetical protein
MATIGELTYLPILSPIQLQARHQDSLQRHQTRLSWRQRILRATHRPYAQIVAYGPDGHIQPIHCAGGRIDLYA